MKRFSKLTTQKLKHYVYALVDPTNEEIFYIGMGCNGTRPFSHLGPSIKGKKTEKTNRISSIQSQGLEPRVEIIRHGLNKSTALEIEAAVIDSIGVKNLTNAIHGFATDRGRSSAKALEIQLGGKPIELNDIKVSGILFYCHKAYPKYNLYDATRQFWKVSKTKIFKSVNGILRYNHAFAMRGSTILEVYKILDWYPSGTTVSSRVIGDQDKENTWEFIGSLADTTIRNSYQYRVIHHDGIPLPATQIGFRYLNVNATDNK